MLYGRLGISMFIGRKLGGIRNLAKYLPAEKWRKATNIHNEAVKLNARGYELQTNLRACISYSRTVIPEYHCPSLAMVGEHKSVVYVFMANGAGKTHAKRVLGEVDDLDEIWADLYGAFREDYEATMPKSSFSSMTHTAYEMLLSSMKENGFLLGQLSPSIIHRTIKAHDVKATCAYFDPGRDIRATRLERRGWSADKVERRLKRAEELYAEAEQCGWKKLKDFSDLQDLLGTHKRERSINISKDLNTIGKGKVKYVFNKTELVTRQLHITEGEKAVMRTPEEVLVY